MIVRPSSEKDILQSNNERMIFVNANYKLFYCNPKNEKLKFLSMGYKFKQIGPDLCVFRPTNEETGKPLNQINFLSIGFSEYDVIKAYEETEGKIVNFHAEEDKLIVLAKRFNGMFMSYFAVEGTQTNFVKEVKIKDEDFISFNLSADQMANGILMMGNKAYEIYSKDKELKYNMYEDILPLQPGEFVQFMSPVVSRAYRKIAYFTK